MAEKSTFGIDATALDKLNFKGAIERIQNDLKTDFIIAPHLSCVFADCSTELISEVTSLLRAGTYSPNLPYVIDVPKKQRITHIGLRRQFANYSRPGGILHPYDRLVLQCLADVAQEVIEPKINRNICYSHQAASPDSTARMFKSSRDCWSSMQKQLAILASDSEYNVVLKVDIAACFQSINQHTLVNNLDYLGFPKEYLKPLESMLTQASVSRSSRGILQGIFPSDLFGNFYLYPIDRSLLNKNIPAVRYVDDIVAFFKSGDDCDKFLVELTSELRRLDLSLNEAKSQVTSPVGLLTSDPDLEILFQQAVNEAQRLLIDNIFEVHSDYGFQAIWKTDDDDDDDDDVDVDVDDDDDDAIQDEDLAELDPKLIAMVATQDLFNQISKYPDNMEEIERFCLPIFAKIESSYAVTHVLSRLETTPSMSQIYYSYLSNFLDDRNVIEKISNIITNRKCLFEWEYLWTLATLLKVPAIEDSLVLNVLELSATAKNEAVRAMCLIVVAKHGDLDHQKSVQDAGAQYTSDYIRGAIVFGARYMQKAVRKNILDVYGNSTPLLKLIAKSTKNWNKE